MSIVPDSARIAVSGAGVPIDAIQWPSGQFPTGSPGSNLCAFLASMNASFGFNLTPHTFTTEWVPKGDPCAFHGASGQLPPIGSKIEFYVGNFLIRGNITHADYTSTNAGTIVNVNIEDNRKELRAVKVHTEDLGGSVPSGVISVARGYREANGLTDVNNNPSDPLIREYSRILEIGSTYDQVLDAIDTAFTEDRSRFPQSELPSAAVIEANIGANVDTIRWQFNLTPLDEAITRILQDTGFDWYWSMNNNQINIINKKLPFEVTEPELLELVGQFGSASGLNETKQTGFGQDVVPDPTRFRVLGGHQHGFLNSKLLSPIDGLDTSAVDGLTYNSPGSVGDQVIFRKYWDQLTIGFYDAAGFYRTYVPTEKELQLSLAGIEQWTYFKKYQTAAPTDSPPGYNLPADDGSIAAQDTTFESRLSPLQPLADEASGANQSGIRIISNRRDSEHNWVIAFYQRVRNHAARHYGRTYVASGLLFNQGSGLYRLIDSAWANVENQIQGNPLSISGVSGPFTEDYEINRDLGPISPFVTEDFRVSAHCVLPGDTVYGAQGDDVPASFANWTEDAAPFNPDGDGSHYIPVQLTVVGQRVIDPRNDDLYAFEAFGEGTLMCQLPINCGPESGLAEDNVIKDLETIISTDRKVNGSGILDIINPAIVLNAYSELSGVAVPVEARARYGQIFPRTWVEGDPHYQRDEDVQLDDQFVPWAFSPEGSKTSIDVMTDRALTRVRGKIVNSSSARYADFQQVGLPLLSFDSFANQGLGPSGLYGEISHGVSELNIQFGGDGFITRYKIKSYFPQFGKEAPLGERIRAILNGIINPIDFTFLDIGSQIPEPAANPFIDADPAPVPIFFDSEKRAVRVTISEVANVFTLSSTPPAARERYRGVDGNGYTKPAPNAGADIDFQEGAICVDGFLNINDEAIYHTDKFELPNRTNLLRYFTGGRPFGNATIVEVAAEVGGNYDVTIVDPGAEAFGIERAIQGIPVLNGSVSVGDKTTLASQGDADVVPGDANNIFLNGTSFGAGVVPVEITAVQNRGSTSATATCVQLNTEGVVDLANGETFSGVIPIPKREFAFSGIKGFLATTVVPNAQGSGVSTSFVNIANDPFIHAAF